MEIPLNMPLLTPFQAAVGGVCVIMVDLVLYFKKVKKDQIE